MRQHLRALLPCTSRSAAVTSALAQWTNSLTDTFAPSVSGYCLSARAGLRSIC
jgi:hypothetical protein